MIKNFNLKKFFNIKNLFLSYPCPICKNLELNKKDNSICDICKKDIIFMSEPYCNMCGGELDGVLEICSKCVVNGNYPWEQAISVFRMEKLGRELLHSFKYNGQTNLARPLGYLAIEQIKKYKLDVDLIIPIPLFWLREMKRGFNQAFPISKIISNELNIKLDNSLKRIKNSEKQASLSRKDRKKNLIDVFSVLKDEKIKNRSILLIDDVFTTGSTLSAGANVLLKAGAKKITIFTLARR